MKYTLAVISLLLLLLAPLLSGCDPADGHVPRPADSVRTTLLAELAALEGALDTLYTAVASSDGSPAAQAEVQAAYQSARRPFKRAEPLVGYLFPGLHKKLNGPALPHIEEYDPNAIVRPPEGFQPIEERIYPAHDTTDRGALLTDVAIARANAKLLRQLAAATPLSDRLVVEAARQHLVRLVALGLSGFDSPVSAQSLPEGAESLSGLQTVLAPYVARLEQTHPALADTLAAHLDAAVATLDAPDADFATFDRLAFIRAHADPLYGLLVDVQVALDVPDAPAIKALRPDARSLFSAATFEPGYFAPGYAGTPTPARVALGTRLFYDPALSADGTRSCATCHDPAQAFTDGLPRSLAADGAADRLRNAPTLLNAGLQASSAYDLTTLFLEDRVLAVLHSPDELGLTDDEAVRRLKADPAYQALFEAAFGPATDDAARVRHLRLALADYVRSLNRMDSPFDRYARGETDTLAAAAQRGFNLFMGKALCGTCHFAPLFNGTVPPGYDEHEAEVLGVPARPDTAGARVDPDVGRHRLTGYELHRFAFKTPTVRNAALTAPYMHNGVYETLEKVMDFYNRGGGAGIGIDLAHQTLPPDPLDLTDREIQDLVAFMHALTDTAGTAPPRVQQSPAVRVAASRP